MQKPLSKDPEHLGTWQDKLIPYDFLLEKSRETGFIKRFRKLNPVYLLYVLIFGISSHGRPTFEEIYRRYVDFDVNPKFSTSITVQSFKKRFDQNMVNFLSFLLEHYINVMISECPARFKNQALRFKDILIQDSSIIRLSKKLFEASPGARSNNNAAGLKIHAVYSAHAHSVKTIQITGERIHDSKMLRIGRDVKNVLIINDLGYYSLKIFTRIKYYGGFFVSRLKTNAKPKVVSVVSGKISKKLKLSIEEDNSPFLSDFLEHAKKTGIYDLVCSFEIEKGQRKKNINSITENFRVICFWNPKTLTWHTYITNLSVDKFHPDEIYELYKYRWIIELLFKELKGDYDLGKLLLGNLSLAYVHIYSMLIRLVISRNLYAWILSAIDPDKREKYGPLLWSKVFAEKCHEFLSILHQHLFGKEDVCERWIRLESSLRHLGKSRHNKPRLSQKFSTP
ncbi:MAG: IS4 family transposase [Candidatus Cloacimonetes bacterium]|nr:IS4 family transposase [Candidatus Cloacimonadota bacterium]